MIRLQSLIIKSDIILRLCEIDEFKGLWNGLDEHTTGLNLIGEVAAHGKQFRRFLDPLEKHDLTPKMVQTLHMTICKNEHSGQYKTKNIQISFDDKGEEIGVIDTSGVEHVPELLEKLLKWTNENLKDIDNHPLLTIGIFAAIFLQIAPFQSHNKRILKLLIALLMLKSGYRYAPFASFDIPMSRRSFQIYEALMDHQKSIEQGIPEWSAWIKAFLDVLIDQKNGLHHSIGKNTNQVADMPALSIEIMNVIATQNRTTMRDIMKKTKGKRSTIKLRLQELIDDKYIIRHGQGRSVWYGLV